MDVHGVRSESKGVFSGSESELEENYSILQWVYRDYSIFYWQEFIPNTHFNLDCTSLFSRSENNTDCTFLLCSLDFHSKLIHSSSGEMGYSFLYHPYTFILPLKAVPQPLISCPPPLPIYYQTLCVSMLSGLLGNLFVLLSPSIHFLSSALLAYTPACRWSGDT